MLSEILTAKKDIDDRDHVEHGRHGAKRSVSATAAFDKRLAAGLVKALELEVTSVVRGSSLVA